MKKVIEFNNNIFNHNIKDINIKDENEVFKILFTGSGDLLLDIISKTKNIVDGKSIAKFYITKEDEVYNYFKILIKDIKENNVYSLDESIKLNKMLKKINANNELLHNGIIEIYSDSTYNENANLLKIIEEEENIILEFTANKNDSIHGFGVLISNSGSKYKPYNICFMKLFHELQK